MGSQNEPLQVYVAIFFFPFRCILHLKIHHTFSKLVRLLGVTQIWN